jgi:glycosyltransferase involved in cell wall biosynthesis
MKSVRTNTKKVLIFSTAYLPSIGGAEIALNEITQRFPEYEFRLVTAREKPSYTKEEKIGNVTVYRIGFGKSWDKLVLPLLGTFFVLKMLRSWEPDFFWGMMATYASGIPYIVNIIRRNKRIPIVLTLQEGDSEVHIENKSFGIVGFIWRICMLPVMFLLKRGKGGGMIQLAWRLALPRTDVVQVISDYLAERVRHYGYTGDIEVVPNGVAVDAFRKGISDNEKAQIRQSLQLPFSAKVLVNVSRLVTKNNVSTTIEMLRYLSEDIHLVILGDGELRQELVEQSTKLQLQERVHFVGNVTNERVPAYLAIADIFVRTPFSEGFGIAFIEAMAAGIPVVTSPVGGITDFVVDPRSNLGKVAPTGVFADPDNPRSIASAISMLLREDALREKIITDARQIVIEKYDWERVAGMMERVFQKATRNKM